MFIRIKINVCILVAFLFFASLTTTKTTAQHPNTNSLQMLVDEAARVTLARFADKKLQREQLAITLIDLRDPQHPQQANFRGDEKIYPASVVKLFYLVAAHRWLEDGKLKDSTELRRALKDMIVESSNDATHYVLDVLTDTVSGPELPESEMKIWAERRNAVNRYFKSIGYADINANQKPWCEGPYGRDHIFVGEKRGNRNKLTTNATARLLADIVLGKAVTSTRSGQMLDLMKRDFSGTSTDPDDQAHGFTGIALANMPKVKLWSKAGWTSTTRHDAAYIELPNGARFVLVTYTTEHANERDIIPTVARVVLEGIGKNEIKNSATTNHIEQSWQAAKYRNQRIGSSTQKDMLHLLGKPQWTGSPAGQAKNDPNPEVWNEYVKEVEFSGKLTVAIDKKSNIILNIFLEPKNLSKEDAIKYFGNDYVLKRYDFDPRNSEEESAPLCESPDGNLQYIEYPSKGIALSLNYKDGVQVIEYRREPISRSKCLSLK
ncbi:MAG: hypothetical protein NVSMB56_00720 [Pyrinomonadaceae bacterium]